MKRSKFLCLALTLIMLTGCVKMDVNMSINKDKSMKLSITTALENSMWEQSGENTVLSEEDKKEAEKNGYIIEEYSDGSMTGYTLYKEYKNIDEVSSEKEINFNLNQTMESEEKIFTVKKGFFKNTYTLKAENDTSDEFEDQITSETDLTSEEEYDTTYEDDNSFDFDYDMSSISSIIDAKFNITLPYKAISSNATSTENDGKKLTWNLMDQNLQNLECKFELYNMNNIYLTAGLGIILLVIIIILITKRKPKTPVAVPVTEETNQNAFTNSNNIPVPEVTTPEVNEPLTQNTVNTFENIQSDTNNNAR